MDESLHQLGTARLMRIVALHAIGGRERLVGMCFLKAGVLRIVAIQAELRRRFRQMISELVLCPVADLVRNVAGVAAHVQRYVTAAFFRNIQSGRMAAQAKVLAFIAGDRLQQLLFIGRLMRIVTLDAIADRWTVHFSFLVRSFLVCVTGQAKSSRRGGSQFDPGDIFIDANFMTTQAAHCDRGVDVRPFTLVFMAFQALGGIDLWVQGNGMNASTQARRQCQKHGQQERTGEPIHPFPSPTFSARTPKKGYQKTFNLR
jgi:hypothetical protein